MIISTKVKLSTTDTERAILEALMFISRKAHNYFLVMKKLYGHYKVTLHILLQSTTT